MSSDRRAFSRIIFYLCLLLLPVIITTVASLSPGDLFAYNLGRAFAMTAFVILERYNLLWRRGCPGLSAPSD